MPHLAMPCPRGFRTPSSAVAAAAAAAAHLLAAAPAMAHHSSAIYDLERTITLDGTVTEYEWLNPHVYLHVATEDEMGQRAVWQIEASPPTLMARRGWSPTSFSRGDHVIVEANPAKNGGQRMAIGRSVRKDDGTVYRMSQNAPNRKDPLFAPPSRNLPADGLEGTWTTLAMPGGAAMEIVFGPTSWPLTARGRAAVDSYDDSRSPAADCIAYTAPFSMAFPDLKIVERDKDVTTIRSSLENAERIIHMDVAAHDGAAYSNQGHSIGRFEGDVLVVDTARFSARPNGNAFKLPSSRLKHLVERYTLSEDRTRLLYHFELSDPEYLAEPIVGDIQWAYTPDGEFAAAGCNLENARRYLAAWRP